MTLVRLMSRDVCCCDASACRGSLLVLQCVDARIRVRLREKFSGWFDPQMGASSAALLHVKILLG